MAFFMKCVFFDGMLAKILTNTVRVLYNIRM